MWSRLLIQDYCGRVGDLWHSKQLLMGGARKQVTGTPVESLACTVKLVFSSLLVPLPDSPEEVAPVGNLSR